MLSAALARLCCGDARRCEQCALVNECEDLRAYEDTRRKIEEIEELIERALRVREDDARRSSVEYNLRRGWWRALRHVLEEPEAEHLRVKKDLEEGLRAEVEAWNHRRDKQDAEALARAREMRAEALSAKASAELELSLDRRALEEERRRAEWLAAENALLRERLRRVRRRRRRVLVYAF